MTDTMYVVVIHYSFDADVPVFWFRTEQDCKNFIKYEFEKERRLTHSNIDSTFISDNGEYASITYLDGEYMDWNLTYVTDKRNMCYEYTDEYVCQLPQEKQNQIREQLIQIGIIGNDLDLAMNSKLKDIEYLLKSC